MAGLDDRERAVVAMQYWVLTALGWLPYTVGAVLRRPTWALVVLGVVVAPMVRAIVAYLAFRV